MNKLKSRTSLVLMELIITILFFSLASAVCVQLFVNSHLISKDTYELNNAINIAQSCAEVMRGTNGSVDAVSSHFSGSIVFDENDYFQVFYDENFKMTEDILNASYVADITISRVSRMFNMQTKIVRLSDYKEIYALDTSTYIRKGDE